MTQILNLPTLTTATTTNIVIPVVDLNTDPGRTKKMYLETLSALSRGKDGIQGIPGVKGDTGYIGCVGFFGSLGYIGSEGGQGIIGYAGSQGFDGGIGYRGSMGFFGSIGYFGSPSTEIGYFGSVGERGPQGYWGSAGKDGNTGGDGNTGYTGSPGSGGSGNGYWGSVGYRGSVGYWGSQGGNGDQGPQGYWGSLGYAGSKGIVSLTVVGTSGPATLTNGVLNIPTYSPQSSSLPPLSGQQGNYLKTDGTTVYWSTLTGVVIGDGSIATSTLIKIDGGDSSTIFGGDATTNSSIYNITTFNTDLTATSTKNGIFINTSTSNISNVNLFSLNVYSNGLNYKFYNATTGTMYLWSGAPKTQFFVEPSASSSYSTTSPVVTNTVGYVIPRNAYIDIVGVYLNSSYAFWLVISNVGSTAISPTATSWSGE